MALRSFFIAGILAVLVGCAAPGKVATPLPLDLNITAPAPNMPKEAAAFSGTWVGLWEGKLEHTLVVEKIEGASATTVYSWGTEPSWGINRPGFTRQTGTIEPGGLLRVKLANGAEVVYKLAPDQQSLNGQYTLRGNVTLGAFRRPQP